MLGGEQLSSSQRLRIGKIKRGGGFKFEVQKTGQIYFVADWLAFEGIAVV